MTHDPFDDFERSWTPKEMPADDPFDEFRAIRDIWSGTRDTDRRDS